jgi:hypothetical protein
MKRDAISGPWSLDIWSGRVAIQCDDLPEDAALELVGSFGSERDKIAAGQRICDRLNQAQMVALEAELC